MMKNILKQPGMMLCAMMILTGLATSVVQAGSLLDDMLVKDTCGVAYADKLASCTPFRCQKPSSLAAMLGTLPEDAIKKLTVEERVAMKAQMTSVLEIKGYDAQGLCHTETILSPKNRQDCDYDAKMLKRVSDFQNIVVKAGHVESKSNSGMVDGKWVSKTVTKVDGKIIDNPMVETLSNGTCKTLEKDTDRGWVTLDQINRMAHIKLNLSERGKHVAGHVRVLNTADGTVVFDKDVATDKGRREINLDPGTYDIEISSKNPQLAPIWKRGIKFGKGNALEKDVEFYAVTGTLKLTVNINGQPSNMAVYMHAAETHQWLVLKASTFGKKPSFYFKSSSIKLPETLTGKYEVFVTPVMHGFEPPAKAKYKKFLLTIKNGDTTEKTVDFSLNKPSTLSNAASTQTAQAREAKAINPGANRTKDNTPPSQRQAGESAGKSSNTLFILDASGSMWGQIKGKPKITIAKEVMAKLVPELPDNARIGLIAYGHRRKGDCNDVETLVRLGTGNKKAVLNAVKGLNAKGKTPLTRSVSRAFKMLQLEKQPSTIILVSDGIESCNADPCKTVKAAKKYGVNFILHTVGFGLSKKESVQLQCMAKAGGGQYFQANNAEELLKSARKAVKSKGPGRLKLTLMSNGKPVNAWVRLNGNGSIGLVDLTNDAGEEPGHIWHLQPGTYKLETYPAGLRGVEPMVVEGIKIEPGKTVEKTLDFSNATLRLTATENGKPAIVQISLKNLASGKTVFDTATFSTFTMRGVKTPYDVKVMPGKYQLSVKLPTKTDLAPWSEEIDLTSNGAPVETTINFETNILRITAIQNDKPGKAQIYVDDLIAKRNIFNSDFLVSYGFQTPHDLTLPPGKYRLTVKVSDVATPHIETLEITSGGEVIDKTIDFKAKPEPIAAKDMEQDTDRPWNDFRSFVPQTADPVLCQNACQDDPQCRAWTYVKPNTVQGPQPHCYLKSPAPNPTHNACCVSGIRRE